MTQLKPNRDSDIPPSDMFIDSLDEVGFHSMERECEWCGRLHLCPDAEADSDDWHQYCLESQQETPDSVILHFGCDSVTARILNGTSFVLGCPCNGLRRYEQFIWEHKNTIRKYLKARIELEHRLAEEQLTINRLMGIS